MDTLLKAVKEIVDNALHCTYCEKVIKNFLTREDELTFKLYGTCQPCYDELTN